MAENLAEKTNGCDGKKAIQRAFGKDSTAIIIYECPFQLEIKCDSRYRTGETGLCILRESTEPSSVMPANPVIPRGPAISAKILVYYSGR
jgi:hypothetical protein